MIAVEPTALSTNSTSDRERHLVARHHQTTTSAPAQSGPSHRSEGKPNEDSWLGTRGAFGTLIVVSDGWALGKRSAQGAQMACRAVLDAVRCWHRAGTEPSTISSADSNRSG